MIQYILRRLAVTILVVLAVSILTFILTQLAVDPAAGLAGPESTAADIAQIRKQYGLDRPILIRYLDWAYAIVRGDLGMSLHYRQPAADMILTRLPVTAILAVSAMLVALAVAIPLGVLAALKQDSVIDRLAMALAVVGQAVPSFWFGLMLIIFFGVKLGWLPISGSDEPANYVMPSLSLALFLLPALLRLTRAGMIEVLGAEYIRAARARGLFPMRILFKHALRNAVMPLVSVAAVQFGYLLGGSIVTEQIFAMHGVGFLAWQAILAGDTAIIQAVVLMMTLIYALLTFMADVLNAYFNPRVRLG